MQSPPKYMDPQALSALVRAVEASKRGFRQSLEFHPMHSNALQMPAASNSLCSRKPLFDMRVAGRGILRVLPVPALREMQSLTEAPIPQCIRQAGSFSLRADADALRGSGNEGQLPALLPAFSDSASPALFPRSRPLHLFRRAPLSPSEEVVDTNHRQ